MSSGKPRDPLIGSFQSRVQPHASRVAPQGVAKPNEDIVRPVDRKALLIVLLAAASLQGCAEDSAEGYIGQTFGDADRIVVSWEGKEIVESDRGRIKALVSLMEIERLIEPHKCDDGPRLDFYRGGNPLPRLTLSHGEVLRRADHSKDARLTKKSAQAIQEWLKAKGVPASAIEGR